MSLARVFCSWSIAAVLLLLSIAFSNSAESEKSLDPVITTDGENGEEGNGTANVTLTGNPRIDYVHDPNLPRELNGYNLSEYPFYHRVPKNINFSCDGRKDGFYASVEHKCQIYHHCLFGSRFDFICANYTAFDQRTFICQFVSDVDCPNSHMYFHRNKDLYVAKSTTTSAPIYIDRDIYTRRRPAKKPKNRPRLVGEVNDDDDTGADKSVQKTTETPSSAAPPAEGNGGSDSVAPHPKKNKETEYYADDDYYEDDYPRRPTRPARRRFRKCRNGRRRGRRCRPRRPLSYYYDDEDYAYDDDYDYAYYDDVRPRKGGKRRRPVNAIPAGTSQVTSTSSSETPPPTTTTTTTTTTEPPPLTSSELSVTSDSDFGSIAVLQKQREELLKARRPWRPSRQNDKPRGTTTTTTSSTTTERARPSTTTTERTRAPSTTTTTTTTEIPQYIYDYEYYEDDTAAVDQVASSPTPTTTTTVKPFLRGKLRGGNSAQSQVEKQRVQQSIQIKVTEDAGTSTNTIRRRDNSNVQTPTRVATLPPISSTTSTTPASTTPVSRPARFWQRKSTVKSISTTTTPSSSTTTTTTLAPYYQEYQDYEDAEEDPQPTAPAKPVPPPRQQQSRQANRFQAIINNVPQHQYGTSPAAALMQPLSYASNAPSASPQLQQQSVTSSSRGHGSSLSSSSYAPARPNKHYAMQQNPQQYSQSSSSSTSVSSSNNRDNRDSSNYNTNSYHRQRSPSPPSPPVVPKPEFISLVDEDYNNPYVSGPSGSTSPASTRYHGGGGGGGSGVGAALGSPGYHHQQHPIRFFEQHHQPAFLFGAASEYNSPQFAFPPRNYPSPSNFQPYGHSSRRFAPHMFK